MTDERLFALLDRFFLTAKKRNHYPARLGLGDANKTLYATEGGAQRVGYVWARVNLPGGTAPRQVLCRKAAVAYGQPVWVTVGLNGDLEVVEEDVSEALAYWGEFGTGNSPQHAPTHGYYGADPLTLDSRQVKPLLTRPANAPGLSVWVEALFYMNGGSQAYWPGGALDLSAYVPTVAGHQRIVITALHTLTNTLTAFAGNTAFYNYSTFKYVPFTGSDVAAVSVTGQVLLSGAVRLYAGQTRIDKWDCFLDARNWLMGRLNYDDILTDSDGDVLSDTDGNVLTI
ncbi:MAG: hypothetical protein K8I82_29240 [Anaerolineae bacterium]|nr:hypothetical protein [Anaerolineae bacterium]